MLVQDNGYVNHQRTAAKVKIVDTYMLHFRSDELGELSFTLVVKGVGGLEKVIKAKIEIV